MRRVVSLAALAVAVLTITPGGGSAARPALLLEGIVVTMDDNHDVLRNGRVLVRDGVVVAVWSGSRAPRGIDVRGARVVGAGHALVFPGLIDAHDHPGYDVLQLWPAPSSHAQPALGRPTGREPYDNRYEWNTLSPPEFVRLVASPADALTSPDALGLLSDVQVHAEVRAALGGETALQGERPDRANGVLVRDVDETNFGRDRIEARVQSVDSGDFTTLRQREAAGEVDAWLVHLAEGVRDGDRVPGDSVSSRHELDTVRSLGLLNDALVVIHGTALERADFAAMRAAPSVSPQRPADGLGAKLVWSPLSNLVLYGHTTNVYDALAEGVTVSLSTDWTPSGSNTLLDELKVADIALRDRRVLGASRDEVPALAGEQALDRLLVDMVTRNPARTLRWPEVGSIETGKRADLLVLSRPAGSPTRGLPDTPYRNLIDATQRDVRLVLVDGAPVAGDPDAMHAAGAAAPQLVRSAAGRFVKAVSLPRFHLAAVERTLADALHALGGDRAGTFAYLRQRWNGGRDRGLSDAAFRDQVLAPRFGRVGGRIDLERIELGPLFTADDHFFFTLLGGRVTKSGLPADPAPPFRLYRANHNQSGRGGNPFAAAAFHDRWYRRR